MASSRILTCFINCLQNNLCSHMLYWTDIEKEEFEVKYVHKKSKGWNSTFLDLFKRLDLQFGEKYKNQPKYEELCKVRCKANLQRLCNRGLIKYLGEKMPGKNVTLKKYRILQRPVIKPGQCNMTTSRKRAKKPPLQKIGKYVKKKKSLSDVPQTDVNSIVPDNNPVRYTSDVSESFFNNNIGCIFLEGSTSHLNGVIQEELIQNFKRLYEKANAGNLPSPVQGCLTDAEEYVSINEFIMQSLNKPYEEVIDGKFHCSDDGSLTDTKQSGHINDVPSTWLLDYEMKDYDENIMSNKDPLLSSVSIHETFNPEYNYDMESDALSLYGQEH